MIELIKQTGAIEVKEDKANINLNKPTLKGEDGEDGGYYIPYINEYCELYFTPTKPDMPKVNGRNIRGNRGEKGEAGADGKDGFNPNVYLGDLENGTRVYIVTKEGTKQFDVLNGKDGKDGTAKVTIKSKYYANDFIEGVVWCSLYASTGEVNFMICEPLPDNAYIVDIVPRSYGVDYRLTEMFYNGMLHPETVINIHHKPIPDETFGYYIVGRTYNDYDGTFTTALQMMDYEAAQGFTLYYIECDEVEVNKE